ncbi:MAG: F0F1 ATP synthase subunit C [Candidatus Dadabacteria bacterium]|nr:MAG: F0F1 ATP synthase subunit C [Candidatus Dadabacteria bacterium]
MTFVARSLFTLLAVLIAVPAFAAEHGASGDSGMIALAAGLAIGIAALGGALAQGRAAAAALEGLARNPEAKVMGPMILGLALIESLVIYALIIAFSLAGKVG